MNSYNETIKLNEAFILHIEEEIVACLAEVQRINTKYRELKEMHLQACECLEEYKLRRECE